ncbi:Spc3p [Sugiyamaella lignohabitans]|uniref:Signal peptidase subunit 3 n=1 Tax=Sugiyamaella lignohabitans TaxID=796027 RepID=A0A167ESX7_9ASCO|nr:Spc3p [Sugiyamaella lignohabitans]ANB14415.1 Spc3p [Sugiyamaella lignohabitans]
MSRKVAARFGRRGGSVDGKAKDNYRIKFDLSTDLSPLFNWNTKQVFVYLTAEYDGKREDINNRVTFWDSIIKSKEDAVLDLKNVRGSYSVYDVGSSLENKNATIRLEWNVQPHVGFLIFGETVATEDGSFIFPALT